MARRVGGFSLLEVVLAVGVFALAATLFASLISVQARFAAQNRDIAESMEILDDFCTFVDVSSFEAIEKLANERATLYVTEDSEDNIFYRKFTAKNDLAAADMEQSSRHTVEIERMATLFTDEGTSQRSYIPLLCRLSRINGGASVLASNGDFSMFVTVKNY
jgi:arginine deiminase